MTGEALDIVPATALVTADCVSTPIESPVPGSSAGHRKLTRVAEAASTGTRCPLTVTSVPPRSKAFPDGSARSVPGAASHRPVSEAMAFGLHEGAAESRIGIPASTSMATTAFEDCPAEFAAVNVISYFPPCDGSGVHWKLPVAASNDAPVGIPAAANWIGRSLASSALTVNCSGSLNLANCSPGAVSTGPDAGRTTMVSAAASSPVPAVTVTVCCLAVR